MTVIPTTERPFPAEEQAATTGLLDIIKPSPIDFLEKKLVKYPYLKLKPDSLLAKAVIYQYQQAQKGTTERPSWPEDLCGYIESVEAQAAIEKDAEAFNPRINGIPDSKYPQDTCITPIGTVFYTDNIFETGVQKAATLPGTLAYAKCEIEDRIVDLYDVDWTGYFNNPIYPSLEELTDEEKEGLESQFTDVIAAASKSSFNLEDGDDPAEGDCRLIEVPNGPRATINGKGWMQWQIINYNNKVIARCGSEAIPNAIRID